MTSFNILCDHCHQPCYTWEYDYDAYKELNDIRKAIYEHKCNDECKKVFSIPKFPIGDHDHVL